MISEAEGPAAPPARVRGRSKAADRRALVVLLPRWQGVTRPRTGSAAVRDAVARLRGAALPFSDLEDEILPARVSDYAPEYLDRLCADGSVTWQGCERTGERDGRIALYRCGDVAALARIRVPVATEPAASIRQVLAQQGGLSFAEIAAALDGFHHDILRGLWKLVWNGEVSSDTLIPLRSLQDRRGGRRRARTGSRRRRLPPPGSGGRWSLISGPGRGFAAPAVRETALVRSLLDRYGVLTRELVTMEEVPGGLASLFPVLNRMVETGELRRGVFIQGWGEEQYALPEACGVLRDVQENEDGELMVLAATDPANVFGAALRWPRTATAPKPQRVAGARVILAGGTMLGYLDRTGRSLLTFVDGRGPGKGQKPARLAAGLASLARRGQGMLIEQVNGAPSAASELDGALRDAGFVASSRGYLCRPRHR